MIALSRRSFVKLAGFLSAAAALGTGSLALADSSAKKDAAATSASGDVEMTTITDMAGREVTFPANPQRIFSSSPTCEAFLCALVPECVIGWANDFTEEALTYYPEEVRDLETIGGWYGGNEGNAEGIVTMAPDVVVAAYNVKTGSTYGTDVEELETKLGCPIVCVSNDIADIPEVFRKLGEWFGVAEKGQTIGDYVQGELDKVDETIAAVPEDEYENYYYAEDTSGLQTEGDGSFHIAVFDYCKMINAADVEMTTGMGMEEVSLEQVLQWDPQNIFVYSKQAYRTITEDAAWADLTAVQEGHVYINPSMPQNWFDRSPNGLRVLGCLYATAMVYPEYLTYDLETEVKDYFLNVYGIEVTDEMYDALFDVEGEDEE